MAIPKKKVPLVFLEILKPENLKNIHPVEEEEAIMCLYDNELGTGFYFKICSENPQRGEFLLEINPPSKNSTTPLKVSNPVSTVIQRLNSWIELIDSYGKIETIYDDPIIKAYEAEFERKYDIVDEDADVAPFNLEQQGYLDGYLESVKKQIVMLKEGKSEEELKDYEEIERDTIQLQKDLTKETKRKVIKKLSRIWAKAQKIGIPVIKEILINFSAELAVKLLTKGN